MLILRNLMRSVAILCHSKARRRCFSFTVRQTAPKFDRNAKILKNKWQNLLQKFLLANKTKKILIKTSDPLEKDNRHTP